MRIFTLPNTFRADYIGRIFSIFAQKFGNSINPMLGNIHEIFFSKMLQINLGNFSLFGKAINVDLFHYCPKKLGTLKNLPVLKFFWHFGNSYSAKKNVEDSFCVCPKTIGTLKIFSCFEIFLCSLRKKLPHNFGQIMKVKNLFFLITAHHLVCSLI